MKSIGTTLNLCFVNLSFVLLSCTVKYNIRTLSVKIKRKEIIEGDNTIVAPLVKQILVVKVTILLYSVETK
jgi:hypothetical protein